MNSSKKAGTACAECAPSASLASHSEQPVFGLQCRRRLQAASLQRAVVRPPVRAARAIAESRWLAGAPQSLLPSLALASAVPPRHQHSRPAPKHAAGVSSEAARAPPHNDPSPGPNLWAMLGVCVRRSHQEKQQSAAATRHPTRHVSSRAIYYMLLATESFAAGGAVWGVSAGPFFKAGIGR